MEPQPESTGRGVWIALGVLGAAVVVALAILLDFGPLIDEELSEEQFLARGDEICAQAHEDFEGLQSKPPPTATKATELTEALLAISDDELDAIAELNGPSSLDAPLDRYLKAREGGIESIRAGLAAAEDGDATAYSRHQAELASGQLDRLKLAKRIGFTECSSVLFGRDQLERDSEPPDHPRSLRAAHGGEPADRDP